MLLKLTDDLIELIRPVVLAQFLITSLMLCVLGFQLVMHDSIVKRIAALTFGFSIIIQLFIYSYGGQLIKDKSSSIAEELYDLDKDLLLVITRASRASIVRAGFFEADLPTFRAFLSSAASLITLLKSFME